MTSMPGPRNPTGLRVDMATVLAIGLVLAGCSSAGPPPATYVLGSSPPAIASTEPLTGRPVIELKRVLVPDYLDVSDIMVRQSANLVAPSPAGRWGERLSVGITRALALDLSRRLPGFVVATTSPGDSSKFQVLVDVEDFGPRADGTVVLLARWRLVDAAGRRTLAGQQVSLTDRAGVTDDAAIAAAMTREVDDLASGVAAGVRRETSSVRRAGA